MRGGSARVDLPFSNVDQFLKKVDLRLTKCRSTTLH